MLAWIIVIVLLLLLLILQLGADAAYGSAGFVLKLKVGPLSLQLLPRKEKKRPAKKPSEQETEKQSKKTKEKQKLSKDEILELIRIGLHTLDRLRLHLSVDLLELEWIAGSANPYDAVLQYGRVNAALGTLHPLAQSALRLRKTSICTDVNLEAETPAVSGRLILTIQIWELLLITICTGAALLRWHHTNKTGRDAVNAPRPEEKGI